MQKQMQNRSNARSVRITSRNNATVRAHMSTHIVQTGTKASGRDQNNRCYAGLMSSGREIWIWLCGMIVAGILAVLGAIYLVHFVSPPDMRDPLTSQGGLKPSQK
jgi:hypothetical protein